MAFLNHEGREGIEGREDVRSASPFEPESRVVVDAGLKVHRALGPGLLESVYEQCLAHELGLRGIPFRRQVVLPVMYDSIMVEAAYRIDLLVNELVVVEIKAVEMLTKLHQAQMLTYLKLSGLRTGLLMNFNVHRFTHGLRRIVR